jgi:hypothetical protein
MSLRVADAAHLHVTVAMGPQDLDEGGEVREVSGRNLGGGGQMLQAERSDRPGRGTLKDLSNARHLCA